MLLDSQLLLNVLFLLQDREEWYRGDGGGDLYYVLRVGDVLIGDDERDLYDGLHVGDIGLSEEQIGEIYWREENLRKFNLDDELWIGVLDLCEE